jgi:hypothetical protein
MTKVKALAFLLALTFLSSCNIPFFKVVSNSFVKEMCSCLFVVGQSEEYCKSYARQIVPVSQYTIDRQNKLVSAIGLGLQGKANFISDQLGCRLQSHNNLPSSN